MKRCRIALLALGLMTSAGCVGTQHHPGGEMVGAKRVLAMAAPTEKAVPHQMQRLQAAFVRDDGTLLLHIQARLINTNKTLPCTLVIPPVGRPTKAQALARRVEVPTAALQLGRDETAATQTNLHPLPLGPELILQPKQTYVWDNLAPAEGREEELRLVHRLGTVSQWEILLLRAHPTATQSRFTIFEVRPTMVPVDNRAMLALMPLALAEDVVTNVSTGPAIVAAIVAAPVGVCYYVGIPVFLVCSGLWEGTKYVGRAIGLVEKESVP